MDGLFPFSGFLAGIITVVTGIIILVWPRILAYAIGIYLIIVGLLAILAAFW